jgi:hypothetical protein
MIADQSPTTTSVDRDETLGSRIAAVAQTLISTVNRPRSDPVAAATIRLSAKMVELNFPGLGIRFFIGRILSDSDHNLQTM